MPVVTRSTFDGALRFLWKTREFAVDTETTGLRAHHGDKPFSIVLFAGEDYFYFNWNDRDDVPRDAVLLPSHFEKLAAFFKARRRLYYMHNAKFDMQMLYNVGIAELKGVVWDTQVGARIEYSDHFGYYSLSDCAARIGEKKDDAVAAYVRSEGLFEKVEVPGKERKDELQFYDQVPWDLIVPYAGKDAEVTWKLGRHQRAVLAKLDAEKPPNVSPLKRIVRLETALTRTVFHVERRGLMIDRDFCLSAIEHEGSRLIAAAESFERLTGREYKASPKLFRELWGERPDVPLTKKGNPSFEGEVIEALAEAGAHGATEVAQARDAKSRLNYYHGFLYHADDAGFIHTNLNQAGTKTGRFSSSNPNLQNLEKPDAESLKERFCVRRAFIPPPGFDFLMFDMDQAEYRLMLDYAGARSLIDRVLGGLDVHQATADLAGITRSQAKTANFAKLYGSGIKAFAAKNKMTLAEAKALYATLDAAAPEVPAFIKRVQHAAESKGYISNWLGRRWHLADWRLSYKAPNALIQGGVGDAVKLAMVKADRLLAARGAKTYLAMNVHDELIFALHRDERALAPELHAVIQSVYPHRFLPLTWGADWSPTSLADKIEGFPPC